MRERIKKSPDYWYNLIMGGILTFLLLYLSGNLIINKIDLPIPNIPYFALCLLIVIYYQWKDDNLKSCKTDLSKKHNFELTQKALDKLNWKYETNSTEIKLTYNKFLLKFLNVTIIPKGKRVCFNFQYHSTSRTGRFPFYFGISTFLEWKFKRSLKSELNNIKPNA